jgi:hypothetical protein
MPTIIRFGNVKIAMYPGDHNPPHFHLLTPDHAAIVSLATLEIIAGFVPRQTYEMARAWAVDHMDELWSKWTDLNG